jgi:hypothetical protein
MHKGFICLDAAKGQVYISRNVVFDESIYHISNLSPNASACLRTEIQLLPSNLSPSSLPSGDKFRDDSTDNMHVIPVSTNASRCLDDAEIFWEENSVGKRKESDFSEKSAGHGEGARTKAGYVAESVPAELEVDSPVLTDSPITTSLVHTRESMPAFHVPYVETTATVPS